MTSLPAQNVPLKDRRKVKLGFFPGLVFFGPATNQDQATLGASPGKLFPLSAALLIIGLSIAAPAVAVAQTLGQLVGTTGEWQRYQLMDAMTGRLSCTGLYRQRKDILLSPAKLAILYAGRGTPIAYEYQIGSSAPSRVTMDRYERLTSAVLFLDPEFQRIKTGDRLRFTWHLQKGRPEQHDVDLSGVNSVLQHFRAARCFESS